MAELNLPSHRWHQKQNHVRLALEDFSRQYIYDSGLRRIDGHIMKKDGYAIGADSPNFLADFKAERYYADTIQADFLGAITHTRNGNATMTGDYGPELVTNGSFDSGSNNWTDDNLGSPSANVYQNGELTLYYTDASNYGRAYQVLSLTVGKVYEVEAQGTQGHVQLRFGGSVGNASAGAVSLINEVVKYTFEATAPSQYLTILAIEAGANTVTNISVREVPKIQWAPHNLLTYSEQFDNAAWGVDNSGASDPVVTANHGVAPNGSQTADRIQFDKTGGTFSRIQQLKTGLASARYTFTVWLKNNGSGTANVGIRINADGVNCEVTESWQSFTVSLASAGTTASPQILLFDSIVGNDETADVLAWGAHLYRSDLGGMADVPADERAFTTATKYVRTAGRVIGPELVTNGTFDSDLTGWTDVSTGTGTVALTSNAVVLTGPDTSNRGKIRSDNFATVSGAVYELKYEVVATSGTSADLQIQPQTSSGTNLADVYGPATIGDYVVSFVAASSLSRLEFNCYDDSVTIDNISVKQIDVDPSAARYLPRRGHHVYNGSQWVNEGLLHESEARTNLVTSSNVFSGTYRSSVVPSASTGPDGLLSMSKLVEDTTVTSAHQRSVTHSLSAATAYTHSEFFKAGERTDAALFVTSPDMTSAYVYFDISAGIVTTTGGGAVGYVEDFGNDVFRCSITFTTVTGGSTTIRTQLVINGTTNSYTGDGTSGFYIYGEQLEAASTPSSYIPTNGATVTRPAESITIPAANLPWPTPQYVTGEELVTNGTFDGTGNVTGWTVDGAATNNNGVDQLDITSGGATNVLATQGTLVPTVGKTYEVKFDRLAGSSGTFITFGGTTTPASSTPRSETHYITATDPYALVLLSGSASTRGVFDNISVKEISPLALSIQMSGEMTYADEGSVLSSDGQSGTAIPWRWFYDTTNYIDAVVDTESTSTGKIWFMQEVGGVFDYSNTSDDYLSPGINVPFNIASRHGSTFINGAVGGVALTANTTPVALPDLENTDLELAYDFMGTISLFRVWVDDLGDTGIEEATEPSTEATLFLSFDGFDHTSYIDFDWSE